MDKRYLKLLPSKTSRLVEEIEAFARTEIAVQPATHPVSETDPNPDGPSCRVNENRAIIFYRNENFDPQSITHELLHIHRYWVRKIPQILPVSDPTGTNIQVTSGIENALEHITIVPEEAKFGFEPYAHWNSTARSNWESFNSETMNKFAVRKNCLLGWLTISNLVTDQSVIDLARSKIKSTGCLKAAKKLNSIVLKHKRSKETQLAAVVEYLDIPRAETKMIYLDIAHKTCSQAEVEKFKR